MADSAVIQSPIDPALVELCRWLADRANRLDRSGDWPGEQLAMCGQFGVYRWFLPPAWGGADWSEVDLLLGYLKLSQACLTTTFIITQRTGACRRIATCHNQPLKERLLPDLAAGRSFATVGISHLTTSRRHLARPVMTARTAGDGYVLDGYSPWVTGGKFAQTIVTGATLDDGRQILVALPTDLPGFEFDAPAQLVGLSASRTGVVRCREVFVDSQWLMAGPVENVMSQGVGARTGGLETSALAVGLATAAIRFLELESQPRTHLGEPTAHFERERAVLERDLLAQVSGTPSCSPDEIRARANSLALRSTQAALAAAKGTGYSAGHPAGRWCREALFFLVWSCPQPVLTANLCELAGLAE